MNHETKTVLRWIDNDEDVSNYWHERTKELKDGGLEHPILDLSNEIEDSIDQDNNPLQEGGVYTDLLYSALSNVSWDEIAELFFKRIEVGNIAWYVLTKKFPILETCKEDMKEEFEAAPKLLLEIEQFTDKKMENIAKDIGEQLEEGYWVALRAAVERELIR